MHLNSRKSLDPRWTSHSGQVVVGFMNVTVLVRRKLTDTPLVYDPATKQYNNPFEQIHTGPARVQPYGINLDLEVGLDPTARRLVLVQLEGKDLGIITDDILTVTAAENNQELLQYQFDVRGSLGSSLEWTTNLVCEADLKYGS